MSEQINVSTTVFGDRTRTNVLKKGEQRLILWLLKFVPSFITPNGMTFIGFLGSLIVFSAFILAIFYHKNYLLVGIIGLMINWLGDSLDGRLAYFRNIPRKWYGFALDIMMDWLSIVLICLGYYFFAPQSSKVLGFLLVVFYGWSIIIALLKYKITNKYEIDSGQLGPTELRIVVALILILEVIIPGSITSLAFIITTLFLALNSIETKRLLKLGDIKDKEEISK